MKLLSLVFLVAVILTSACNRPAEPEPAPDSTAAAEDVRVYEVRGRILEIRDERRELVIEHEEMPGFMAAMTMPFRLKVPLPDDGPVVGDAVSFRFVVQGYSGWIENVEKLPAEEAATLKLAGEPAIEDASESSLYQLDARWTDQNGRDVTLSDFAGRPVALSMVFTNCSYACPMIVSEMKQIAGAVPEARADDVQYVLVSLDPDRDTPEALRHFAAAYGLNEAQWTLLRGDANQVRMLAALLGIRYREQSDGQFSHTSLISLLNEAGEIVHQQKGLGTNDGTAAVLSDLLASNHP